MLNISQCPRVSMICFLFLFLFLNSVFLKVFLNLKRKNRRERNNEYKLFGVLFQVYFIWSLCHCYVANNRELVHLMFLSEGKSPSQTHQECDMDFCRCSTWLLTWAKLLCSLSKVWVSFPFCLLTHGIRRNKIELSRFRMPSVHMILVCLTWVQHWHS